MDRDGAALRPTLRWLLVAAPPLLFLGVFFAYPVASIIAVGLFRGGTPAFGTVRDILAAPFLRDVLWFTVWQAALSTVITVLLGMPGAYVLARYDFPGRRLVRALTLVPFVLPTIVVGSAFLGLLGPRSPLNPLLQEWLGLAEPPLRLEGSIWAILAAHVFYNHAVVVRIVGGLWEQLDPALEEAARTLGASRWQAFRSVTLPRLRPAIASAASLVFLFSFTSFGVILLLGGPRFATLEVEIYRQTAQLLDLPVAAVLATLQLVGVSTLLLVYGRMQERVPTQRLRAAHDVVRRPRTPSERLTVVATVGTMGLLLGLPLLVLVERSLATPSGLGLAAYEAVFSDRPLGPLFVPAWDAVRNSLVFGLLATVLAVGLGIPAAALVGYRRGWLGGGFDVFLMLPLGTSAVTLGFGFIVALDEPPLDLRTSPLLIPIAHAIVALPIVVRATVPVIRSIERRLREAAAVLGASPARAWREVDAPLIARAGLVGAAFAFAVSLGEFGATVFIARPDVPTLPIAVYRLLSQPGALTFGQAMAMSVVLMVATAAAVIVVERVAGGASRPF